MSGFKVNFSVNNQLATPSIHAAPFAQRPAAGQPGRVFIDTDSPSTGIYRDTGTAWIVIGSPGIPEVDTLQTVTDRGNSTTQSVTIGSIDPPAYPLDVYGDTDIINVHATNGNDGVILFSKAGSHRWRAGNYHGGGNDYFSIYNMQENSDGILVALSTNNVAIGGHTTAPVYKLDIAGSLANTGSAYFATSGTGVGIKTTTLATNANLTIGAFATGTDGKITIQGRTNDSNWLGRLEFVNNSGSFVNQIYNSSNGMFFSVNAADRILIARTTGNVLIGTTTDAGYKLDVNGTARVSGALTFASTATKIETQVSTSTYLLLTPSTGLKISNDSWVPSGTASGTTGYIYNTNTQKIFQNDPNTSSNSDAFLFSFRINAGGGTAGLTHNGIRLNRNINNTAAQTYPGILVVQNDNSASIANNVIGIYSDVSGGSNTSANKYSGIFMGGAIGLGTTSPNASALLDITSTTKGFLPPRQTTAQKNAIANTAGLVIFDTDLAKLCVNSGAGWETITSL